MLIIFLYIEIVLVPSFFIIMKSNISEKNTRNTSTQKSREDFIESYYEGD